MISWPTNPHCAKTLSGHKQLCRSSEQVSLGPISPCTPSANMAPAVTTWQTRLNDIAFIGTSRDISTGAAEYRDWPPDEARGIRGSCCLIVDTFPDRSRPPKCTSKSRSEVWPRAIHCCPYATTRFAYLFYTRKHAVIPSVSLHASVSLPHTAARSMQQLPVFWATACSTYLFQTPACSLAEPEVVY